jgi:hypothetical protein
MAFLTAGVQPHLSVFPFQEMLDIMKAIYDMMGKCTYPVLKEDAPRQHVETFFQVGMNNASREGWLEVDCLMPGKHTDEKQKQQKLQQECLFLGTE